MREEGTEEEKEEGIEEEEEGEEVEEEEVHAGAALLRLSALCNQAASPNKPYRTGNKAQQGESPGRGGGLTVKRRPGEKKQKKEKKTEESTFACTTGWNWRSFFSYTPTHQRPHPVSSRLTTVLTVTPHFPPPHSTPHPPTLTPSIGTVQENKRCAGTGRSVVPELTQPESE